MYKYTSTQSNYAEENREVTDFSADVAWHCESSKNYCIQVNLICYHICVLFVVTLFLHLSLIIGGIYGPQSANEYCFTLSDVVIKATANFNPKYALLLYIFL